MEKFIELVNFGSIYASLGRRDKKILYHANTINLLFGSVPAMVHVHSVDEQIFTKQIIIKLKQPVQVSGSLQKEWAINKPTPR